MNCAFRTGRRSPCHFSILPGQFGAKLVQYAKPGVSKKVLAAMADDTDPAVAMANIRKLLVGPTHKLHDAMFEEVVTILEESDREVQQALRALESRNGPHFPIPPMSLLPNRWTARIKTASRLNLCKQELQKSAASHQEMLSEMFLVIDAKIDELTKQVDQKIEALAQRRSKPTCVKLLQVQERKMQELEAKCLARSSGDAANLENRLAHSRKKSSTSRMICMRFLPAAFRAWPTG